MAEVTAHLRNVVPGSPFSVAGATVGEALESVFGGQPQLGFYVPCASPAANDRSSHLPRAGNPEFVCGRRRGPYAAL
jgi:hypothetical protein